MRNFVLLFLIVCGAAWPDTQSDAALKKMRQAYSNLQAIHIVAVRNQQVRLGAGWNESEVNIDYGEAVGGKYRARIKNSAGESISVGNGTKEWKADPKTKQWTMIEAASVGEGDPDTPSQAGQQDDDQGDNAQTDLHDAARNTVFIRYVAIAKGASASEFLKSETLKVGKEKRPCAVVRVEAADGSHDLWIDEERGFVLEEVELSHEKTAGGVADVKTTTKIKSLENNGDVDSSLFDFEPERSWREVETLVLPGERATMLVGMKAVDFSMKALGGGAVRLSDLRGTPVVLDFWATWCPPCREELPTVDKLRREFADKVQFYGVSDEDASTVKSFLQKHRNELPVLMDEKQIVHRQYGVRAIPTLLVIDKDGTIRTRLLGSRSEQALREAIGQVAVP